MNELLKNSARKILYAIFSTTRSMGFKAPEFVARHVHYRGVVDVSTGDGDCFKMRSYGHQIENRLYWYGQRGHEPETFLPWLKVAKTSEVVLDIGANTALFSLGAASKNENAQVHAFEPLPRVASLARNNAQLNPDFNIQVHQNAVCDESGIVTLHDPGGDQPASASLKSDFLSCKQDQIEVEAIRIDDFVSQQKFDRVDLIKLDVEGIEEIALARMQETIQKFKPTLFIEVLDNREELMFELQKLMDWGYQVGDLTKAGVVPFEINKNKGKDRNLVFATNLSATHEHLVRFRFNY